jgi:hypothetical protein
LTGDWCRRLINAIDQASLIQRSYTLRYIIKPGDEIPLPALTTCNTAVAAVSNEQRAAKIAQMRELRIAMCLPEQVCKNV